MISRDFADSISKWTRNMEQAITARKFAEGMAIAALIGAVTGIFIVRRPQRKSIEDSDNQNLQSTITIEVQDLKKLIIERTE